MKDGYYIQVSGSDGKRVIWEVVEDHAVEQQNKNDELGLWGLIFFCKDKRGGVE